VWLGSVGEDEKVGKRPSSTGERSVSIGSFGSELLANMALWRQCPNFLRRAHPTQALGMVSMRRPYRAAYALQNFS
jgi:hypothetical protein